MRLGSSVGAAFTTQMIRMAGFVVWISMRIGVPGACSRSEGRKRRGARAGAARRNAGGGTEGSGNDAIAGCGRGTAGAAAGAGTG